MSVEVPGPSARSPLSSFLVDIPTPIHVSGVIESQIAAEFHSHTPKRSWGYPFQILPLEGCISWAWSTECFYGV
jgi:hypothetical protein